MILWLDNQLSPAIASWTRAALVVECVPVRDLHLQRASDIDIFLAARASRAVVVTKDADFAWSGGDRSALSDAGLPNAGSGLCGLPLAVSFHLQRAMGLSWLVRSMVDG